MKLLFQSLAFITVLFIATQTSANDKDAIFSEIRQGHFTKAKTMIDQVLFDTAQGKKNVPATDLLELKFQKERMDRIVLNFSAKEEDVLKYIRGYYSDRTPEEFSNQLSKWKRSKELEVMLIDGKERYFRAAATNLFLIDKDAGERRRIKDALQKEKQFYRTHIPAVRESAQKSQSSTGIEPRTFTVTYTLRVPADTIPAGEVLRCWLPYPHRNHRRHTNVELLQSNFDNGIVSPKDFEHSTIYGEKVAVPGEDTIFQIKFKYDSTAETFDLRNAKIKSYDKNSDVYKKYTAERETHVIFTPEIQELSQKIVGEETDPVRKAERIFDWVTKNVPWASSREYSTMENIPMYVIENKHGDCGMQGLIFITLCRYNGIPAKWQSGFMLPPGGINLHDWAEVYFEGIGWIPADPSHGAYSMFHENAQADRFFLGGIDTYRLIVNEDYSCRLYPAKTFPRSETVDFQRGEVEWRGGNLYFNQWKWNIDVVDSDQWTVDIFPSFPRRRE